MLTSPLCEPVNRPGSVPQPKGENKRNCQKRLPGAAARKAFPRRGIVKSGGLAWRNPTGLRYGIAGRTTLEFRMKFSRIAVAMAAATLLSLSAGIGLAQSTPDTITAAPPTTAPAPAAPAATTTTPATPTATTTEPAKSPKKKKVAKMNRRGEIDKSIDSGTVPARYRKSVPKEYQEYVPFDKR
jgi:cell division septation protein DedD